MENRLTLVFVITLIALLASWVYFWWFLDFQNNKSNTNQRVEYSNPLTFGNQESANISGTPLNSTELETKKLDEALTYTLWLNGIDMGQLSTKNILEVGYNWPNNLLQPQPGGFQFNLETPLKDLIKKQENPELKNILIWDQYKIVAPLKYANFEDVFESTDGGGVNFRQPVNNNTIDSPVQLKLRDGIVHLPFTPFPGEIGNSYIIGHSSYYSFVESNYKEIFKPIERKSKPGEEFIIYDQVGRKLKFRVFETLEVADNNVEESYKNFPNRRVVTLQCSILENINGRILPTKRWLTRAELIIE